MILSVDPGARVCGCALFDVGVLVASALVKSSVEKDAKVGPHECYRMAREVLDWSFDRIKHTRLDVLVVEMPQTYGGRSSKGDANDLFSIAAVDGALAAVFPSAYVKAYRPHEWKGSIQKPKRAADPYPIERRVKSILSAKENARVEWPKNAKLRMDVVDGIGIGLFYLGRFNQRVFPRE